MTASPPASPPASRSEAPVSFAEAFRDALAYWELRRIAYNALLLALCITWVVRTWPHFQPAFTLGNLGRLVVLGALANVCYCAAYLVDLPVQLSGSRDVWRRRRGVLWVAGTAFALLLAQYWIGDEIYPYVQ